MGYKVIIIDDDAVAVFLHKVFVIKTGLDLEPECFSNARQALEYLKKNIQPSVPYLVFLDINMPEFSGWDVLDQVASDGTSNLEVIMVSSSINESDYAKARSYPMVKSYMEKPLTVFKLNELLENGSLKFSSNINSELKRAK